MAGRVYGFENPDRFIAGAIGQPGSRTFYLQAREGGRVISVVLEKVQVALLAERLTELLRDVRSRGVDIPDEPPTGEFGREPLEEPIVEAFRVGTMAIVWDGDDESVVIEAREIGDEAEEAPDAIEVEAEDAEDDEDDDSDLVRVRLRPIQALAFAGRALEVVASGRPPCPFCGQPLNPEGHICLRRNGYMH